MSKAKRSRRNLPSADRLREVLNYNPDTGEFTWRIRKGNAYPPGKPAGCWAGCDGYKHLVIFVDGAAYKATRIAWAMMTGDDPVGAVYHKDRNTENNAWNNLTLNAYSLEKFPTVIVGDKVKARRLPPVDAILAAVRYDPDTGVFTRNVQSGGRQIGSVAGRVKPGSYVAIGIHGKQYQAHRLAFKIMTGRDPVDVVDHIDGNKQNNAWSNLREATLSQNAVNSLRRSASGVKGVHFDKKRGRWGASISFSIHLGRFRTKGEAEAAVRKAYRDRYGEFAILSEADRRVADNDNQLAAAVDAA